MLCPYSLNTGPVTIIRETRTAKSGGRYRCRPALSISSRGRSLHIHAAVHVENVPGDVARFFTGEEPNRVRYIGGFSDPAEGN